MVARPAGSAWRPRPPTTAAPTTVVAAVAVAVLLALSVPAAPAAADLSALSTAACGSRLLRDAAFVVTISECTADPARCCVSGGRYCARGGGCCYASGCASIGARLVPFVCDPASGAVVAAPAGTCGCAHPVTIWHNLPLPPGVSTRPPSPGCAAAPAKTLPPTVPVVPGVAPPVVPPPAAAAGRSCDASAGTRAAAWTAVVQGCGGGTLPCCAHATAMGTVGGCMYRWAGCEPLGVQVAPLVCVDAATSAVRIADVAAGECACGRVVDTADSAPPPLAHRPRNVDCGPPLAGQTDAFQAVAPGLRGGTGGRAGGGVAAPAPPRAPPPRAPPPRAPPPRRPSELTVGLAGSEEGSILI